eukprot:TRINITY_DN1254_c6_g2_i1.p1 TRINITY_DN1254_c6_g2~~TRINITY_DN1254_c6_g2_i1.p1  ORF type:complete len:640 (+),score=69.95 TRINITY_DN1254_c6_g2_i1:145-2064(+)
MRGMQVHRPRKRGSQSVALIAVVLLVFAVGLSDSTPTSIVVDVVPRARDGLTRSRRAAVAQDTESSAVIQPGDGDPDALGVDISPNATTYPAVMQPHINGSSFPELTGNQYFEIKSYLGEACLLTAPLVIHITKIEKEDQAGRLEFYKADPPALILSIITSSNSSKSEVLEVAYIRNKEVDTHPYSLQITVAVEGGGTKTVDVDFETSEDDLADPHNSRAVFFLGTLWCLCKASGTPLAGDTKGLPPIYKESRFIAAITNVINFEGDQMTRDTTMPTLEPHNVQQLWFMWHSAYQTMGVAYLRNNPLGKGKFAFLGTPEQRKAWYEKLKTKGPLLSARSDIRMLPGNLTVWLGNDPEESGSGGRSIPIFVIVIIIVSFAGCITLACLAFLCLPGCAPCRDAVRGACPCLAFVPRSPSVETDDNPVPTTHPRASAFAVSDRGSTQHAPHGTSVVDGDDEDKENPIEKCMPSQPAPSKTGRSTAPGSAYREASASKSLHSSLSTGSSHGKMEAGNGAPLTVSSPHSSPTSRSVGPILSRIRGMTNQARSRRSDHRGHSAEFVPGPGWENTTDCTEMSMTPLPHLAGQGGQRGHVQVTPHFPASASPSLQDRGTDTRGGGSVSQVRNAGEYDTEYGDYDYAQ